MSDRTGKTDKRLADERARGDALLVALKLAAFGLEMAAPDGREDAAIVGNVKSKVFGDILTKTSAALAIANRLPNEAALIRAEVLRVADILESAGSVVKVAMVTPDVIRSLRRIGEGAL